MRLPLYIRRIAVVLPLVLGATMVPVVGGRPVPNVRHWRLGISAAVSRFRAPGEFGLVGVSWKAGARPPQGVKVRTSTDGRSWSDWEALEYGPDEGPDGAEVQSTVPLWTGSARHVDVRIAGRVPAGASLQLVDPGPDPTTPASSALASPGKPGIITRSQWGADESIRKGKPSYAEPLKVAVIHHTATTNSYSKSESAGIVRSIYAYHVKSNGWDDIGYNFIVDKYGQIFEGRYGGVSRTVVGAHAKGFNRYTAGIAVLGSFEGTGPTAAAMESLKRLSAWRLDLGYVDPQGTTTYTSGGSSKYAEGTKVSLNNITSHRNVGNTSCPGAALYGQLGALRGRVAPYGDPKVYAPRVDRSVITPNGDKYASRVTLTTRFSSAVSWKIDVIDRSGKVWKRTTGSGSSATASWAGGYDPPPPHDVYRFRITAKNGNGSVRTAYVKFAVWRYPNGTLLRTSSGWSAILEKGKLRRLLTRRALTSRYGFAERIIVSSAVKSAYPIGTNLGFRDGSVLRADGKLWVIADGQRRRVSQSTLDALGYDRSATIDTESKYLAPHPVGTTLTADNGYPNGTALYGSDGREARMASGTSRPFLTQAARDSYAIRDVDRAGPADVEVFESAARSPLRFREGTLMQATGEPEVYVISDGRRRHITSRYRFSLMGYDWDNIRAVTPAELALHGEGKPL